MAKRTARMSFFLRKSDIRRIPTNVLNAAEPDVRVLQRTGTSPARPGHSRYERNQLTRGAFTSKAAKSMFACKEKRLPKEPQSWVYLDWRRRNSASPNYCQLIRKLLVGVFGNTLQVCRGKDINHHCKCVDINQRFGR